MFHTPAHKSTAHTPGQIVTKPIQPRATSSLTAEPARLGSNFPRRNRGVSH